MPQYESTADFFKISGMFGLSDYLLLLIAEDPEDPDHPWTAGTAFMIGDRVALTAAHVFLNFHKHFNPGEVSEQNRLRHLGKERDGRHTVKQLNCGFEAVQFLQDGTRLRWNLAVIRTISEDSDEVFDSDLCLLVLEPHADSPAAQSYIFSRDRLPRLQLFPPAVGQPVILCGWPDNPLHPYGKLPRPNLDDDFFFMSRGNVEYLSTTAQSKERRNAPHFRSSARAYNGMSGGPLMTLKPGAGWVICGLHMAGEPFQNISRHSVLWPMLLFDFEHPRLGSLSMIEAMRIGEINAPCYKFFEPERVGNFRRLKCTMPELKQKGTFLGSPSWITCDSCSNLILPIPTIIEYPSLWMPFTPRIVRADN